MMQRIMLLCVIILTLLTNKINGIDFIYEDFNHTDGLHLYGSAVLSSCEENGNHSNLAYAYSPGFGRESGHDSKHTVRESVDGIVETEITTEFGDYSSFLTDVESLLGHRDASFFGGYSPSDVLDCPVRIKLTQSRPHQVGSVWRNTPTRYTTGFFTEFRFQISDLSRSCATVRDAALSTKLYKSCAVHGGDGFAFVIGESGSENVAAAAGAEMGIAGARNVLAVEFDTWYNPENGDLLEDHITVLSRGTEPITVGVDSQLHFPVRYPLADGAVHLARIVYYPYVVPELIPTFKGHPNTAAYIKNYGYGKSIGTFALWMDNKTDPLLAFPINLNVLLGNNLEESRVGFTSSTGSSWGTHDILSWAYCESFDCK